MVILFARFTRTGAGAFRRRDAGRVILGYTFDSVVLPGGVVLSLDGQIMWRPGYYAGAVLDWDLEATVGGERFYLSEYDGIDEMAEDALGAWCWDAGEEEETGEEAEARGLLAEALEAAGATLDGIFAALCDAPMRCAGVFSNGEAIYQMA